MVTSAISVGVGVKAGTALKGGGTDAVNVQAQSMKSQQIMMMGGAVSGLSGALASTTGSLGQSISQTHQADQAREQANAEVTKSEGELEATEQQALQEFINQIIQFLKEMRDAEVEQLAVVTRG